MRTRLVHLIRKTNESFEKYPQESIAGLLATEMSTMFGMYMIISASGIPVPASFAAGFALSRPFRRIRFPIELMAAGILNKAIPELSELKMTWLISGNVPSTVQSSPLVEKMKKWSGTSALVKMVDKYGACYFIGARWTGVVSVLTFTGLVNAGVDVDSVLQTLGLSADLGSTLGSWALAVTLSSFLYPATILVGGGYVAPAIGKRFRGSKIK